MANDEEYARASGMPVTGLNIALAVLTAVTVVVSMRVVGLLLISALMIIPNATAQLLGRSFRASTRWAVAGRRRVQRGRCRRVVLCRNPFRRNDRAARHRVLRGRRDGTAALARARAHQHRRAERHDHEHGPECGHPAVAHGDHVDYVHDGHRHAAHEGHYDEHDPARHEAGRHDADSVEAEKETAPQ